MSKSPNLFVTPDSVIFHTKISAPGHSHIAMAHDVSSPLSRAICVRLFDRGLVRQCRIDPSVEHKELRAMLEEFFKESHLTADPASMDALVFGFELMARKYKK